MHTIRNKSLLVKLINTKQKTWQHLHNQIQQISQKRLMKLKFQKFYFSIQCQNPNQCTGKSPGQGACNKCKTKITNQKEK